MRSLLLILFITILIFSQQKPKIISDTKTGIVKGKVVDADSNFSIRGATVFLVEKRFVDSVAQNKIYAAGYEPIFGDAVDKEDGNYEITGISLGEYIIKCSFIGYKTEVDTIHLNEADKEIIKDFYLKVQPYKVY